MRRTIFLFFVLLMSLEAYAQTLISGTVTDAKGLSVIGAAVQLKGDQAIGTVTDLDGKWQLAIPEDRLDDAVLIISSMGYITVEEKTDGRTRVDVVMEEDSELLEEVVVVGYGAMRRSDLTGSVASVKIDDGAASRSASMDELLQGRAAGVSVVSSSAAPDAAVSVRIRGVTSLNGSNEPLYVIDGVIMTPAENPQMFTQGNDNAGSDEGVNSLMGINPQDIASLEILKDASATAIYGSAGANGVVLITTKSANRDRPVIRASVGVDVATPYKTIDMLSFDEYMLYLRAQGQSLADFYDNPDNMTGLKTSIVPMDWQKYMMRTVVNQRYHLSISGRPKTLNYQFSAGYNRKDGIIRNTGSEQFTLRLNVTKTLFKNFKIGTKTNFAYLDSEMTQGASTTRLTASSSLMRSMMITKPYYRPGADDDEDFDDEMIGTPLQWVSDFRNSREEYRVTPHFFVEWKILRHLEFKSSVGGDFRASERVKWKGATVNSGPEGSLAAASDMTSYTWNIDNTLNYNRKIRRHRIQATLGVTTSRNSVKTSTSEGWNIEQSKIQDKNINSAVNMRFAYNESNVSMNSYFARAVYNYADRYLLTATCRVDGSSKFSRQNRYSVFPSFAFAWRISEEKWFNADFVETLKLRAGWGQVGNSGVTAYQIYSTYGSGTYADHSPGNAAEYVVGVYPNNIANPDLRWETTRQVNLGLDLGLWKGRFSMTVDLYDKNTYDLLQRKRIPISSGFSTIWVNDGSIRNRGLEVSFDATPVARGDFEWNISGNISFNRNEITSIGKDTGDYFLGSNVGNGDYFNAPANIFREGCPVGLFYGYRTNGIVPVGQTGIPLTEGGEPRGPGSISYVDMDGNGYLSLDDRTVIGDPNPDFTYGFSTSLSWKGLSMSVACDGSYGNDIVNANLLQETDISRVTVNVRKDVFRDAWSENNQGGKYPAIGALSSDEVKYMSDRIVEDGSYLRISNVSLSYQIPVPENKVVRGMSVGASARNCHVFTKYSGWDPEVNSYGSDMTRVGIDCGSYPSARTFCFDLKFTF